MKNFIKGFIIGIGKIIPGVSGAMLAISLGVYDKAIDYIGNFNKYKKESIKYLFPIGIGIVVSIILFSKIINFLLVKYYLFTMLFFIGLIIGGIPSVTKNVSKCDYYIVIISFILFMCLSLNGIDNVYAIRNNFIDMVIFFVSGVIETIGTIVPGVSGTALLMIIGTYNIIISTIGNITDINSIIYNLRIIIPFIIGICFSIVIIIKIINFLFKKYNNKVYASILGILISSIVLLIFKSFKYSFSIMNLFIGIIFLFIGIIIGLLMDNN